MIIQLFFVNFVVSKKANQINLLTYMSNTSEKTKVLFVSSEMSPFLEESPVSTFARMIPQAIQEKDNEIRVLVPRFGVINERRNRLHEVVRLSGMNIAINETDNPLIIKVASIPGTKMQVYFLDNEDFFHRKGIYRDKVENKFFKDNDERTIFFCKGALETVKKLGWAPDIIHCQGWMTSLIPLYIKTLYKDEPVFKNAKVVYSVFNDDFKESLGDNFAQKASLNELEDTELKAFESANWSSLNRGGILHSDAVVNCCNGSGMNAETVGHLSEKMVLEHSDDSTADKYLDFYDKVLTES